ncbi:DUF2059 domain-containing protein [Rhodobacteraceae bacterium RKSG542]|uniref:DUF2059 domain-containing protein n=1 Tax=Pseudovibrio flavus TaxID=2529854 RepID=UPI0012BBE66B|nr:DUF2059 domain-containing protein [Pseudovibrio flavus]MTI16740.1 DUF2059 domain-containing protein [Pseudovibrio flavus]
MLAKLKYAVVGGVAAAVMAGAMLVAPVSAQETFSESHIAAAKAAINATRAAETFDNILPDVAEQTRTLFIRSNPAMSAEIDVVVNEVALQMVSRRGELDQVIYEVWARRFTEAELKQIAEFYNTEAGKKLAGLGGELSALSIGAAKQWGDVIATDMVAIAREQLAKMQAQ